MSENLHVVFGTGPAGSWIARTLAERGEAVRAVNLSGSRPDLLPEDVEVVSADASDPAQAIRAAMGAAVLYQALNPPYHLWQQLFPALQSGVLEAAKASGGRYVSIDNTSTCTAASTAR
jgi:nucleoside-diphosphate-sugar epimerase